MGTPFEAPETGGKERPQDDSRHYVFHDTEMNDDRLPRFTTAFPSKYQLDELPPQPACGGNEDFRVKKHLETEPGTWRLDVVKVGKEKVIRRFRLPVSGSIAHLLDARKWER